MADNDSVRRRVTVPDPEGWDDPVTGNISRADVEAYLLAQGWRREGAWLLRGPEGEEDRVPARRSVSLAKLVAHVAIAEGRAPRSTLRDIEALAAETSPTTDRDPRPQFITMPVKIAPDRGIASLVLTMSEVDGYTIHEIKREGENAEIVLRRLEPGEEG